MGRPHRIAVPAVHVARHLHRQVVARHQAAVAQAVHPAVRTVAEARIAVARRIAHTAVAAHIAVARAVVARMVVVAAAHVVVAAADDC